MFDSFWVGDFMQLSRRLCRQVRLLKLVSHTKVSHIQVFASKLKVSSIEAPPDDYIWIVGTDPFFEFFHEHLIALDA